jgi:predicted DNA-binding protein
MNRYSFFLPVPLMAQLKALSERMDMSVAELVRRAVEAYVKKENK